MVREPKDEMDEGEVRSKDAEEHHTQEDENDQVVEVDEDEEWRNQMMASDSGE